MCGVVVRHLLERCRKALLLGNVQGMEIAAQDGWKRKFIHADQDFKISDNSAKSLSEQRVYSIFTSLNVKQACM